MENTVIRETTAEIKRAARNSLAGNWVRIFLAVLIYTVLVEFVPQIIEVVLEEGNQAASSISDTYFYSLNLGNPEYTGYISIIVSWVYDLIITGPFELGLSIFLIEFFRNRHIDRRYVFSGLKQFFKAFLLFVTILLFVILWSLLLIVPGIIAALRYSQSFYILADNPDMGIMDCMDESKRLMGENKTKLLLLPLSFIGWALVAVVSIVAMAIPLGVILAFLPEWDILTRVCVIFAELPVVVLMVYLRTAQVAFYELLIGK